MWFALTFSGWGHCALVAGSRSQWCPLDEHSRWIIPTVFRDFRAEATWLNENKFYVICEFSFFGCRFHTLQWKQIIILLMTLMTSGKRLHRCRTKLYTPEYVANVKYEVKNISINARWDFRPYCLFNKVDNRMAAFPRCSYSALSALRVRVRLCVCVRFVVTCLRLPNREHIQKTK